MVADGAIERGVLAILDEMTFDTAPFTPVSGGGGGDVVAVMWWW
jgi:hypothetical protein